MSKNFFYSALFFLLGIEIMPVNAQSGGGGCGTYVNAAQISFENSFTITEGSAAQSLPQVNRTLSFTVFVVKDAAGLAGVDSVTIYNAISALNQYFTPIALGFRICSAIRYIPNYNFNNLYSTDNEKDLVTLNFERNTINLYLVSNLYDQYGTDVNGYTYMPGTAGKNSIFLSKNAITGSTLVHQMGHFFNLYHTHESAFASELVTRGAGANCSTAGDRCCDTEADPNLGNQNMLSGCIYIGTVKDSNSELYSPSPKNIMSFSGDNCRCAFSRTQYLRIIYALNNFRNNLR